MTEEQRRANACFIVTAVNSYQKNQETIRELVACLEHAAQSYTPKAWAILGEKEIEWQKRSLAVLDKARAEAGQ